MFSSATARASPLAVVAVVMRVEGTFHLRDADLAQEFQNMARSKIYQQRLIAVPQNINVAGISQHEEIARNTGQSLAGSKGGPALRRAFD